MSAQEGFIANMNCVTFRRIATSYPLLYRYSGFFYSRLCMCVQFDGRVCHAMDNLPMCCPDSGNSVISLVTDGDGVSRGWYDWLSENSLVVMELQFLWHVASLLFLELCDS